MVWTQAFHWLAFLVAMNIVLFFRRSESADLDRDRPNTSDAAGAWHFCGGRPCILAYLRSRHHHGALRTGDRMARTVCSLLGLGCRSSYRDWRDVLVAPERSAHLEGARRRIARLERDIEHPQAPVPHFHSENFLTEFALLQRGTR